MKLAAQAPRQEDSESLAVVWKQASQAVIFGAPLSILVPDARVWAHASTSIPRAHRAQSGIQKMPITCEFALDSRSGLQPIGIDIGERHPDETYLDAKETITKRIKRG